MPVNQQQNPNQPSQSRPAPAGGQTRDQSTTGGTQQDHNQPQATYMNRPVTIVRDAKLGDPAFKQGDDKLIIRQEDGTEMTVPRVEVEGAPAPSDR